MTMTLPAAAIKAAAPIRTPGEDATCILKAAETILTRLERGLSVDARALRSAMEEAFGGSDAEGFWAWMGHSGRSFRYRRGLSSAMEPRFC